MQEIPWIELVSDEDSQPLESTVGGQLTTKFLQRRQKSFDQNENQIEDTLSGKNGSTGWAENLTRTDDAKRFLLRHKKWTRATFLPPRARTVVRVCVWERETVCIRDRDGERERERVRKPITLKNVAARESEKVRNSTVLSLSPKKGRSDRPSRWQQSRSRLKTFFPWKGHHDHFSATGWKVEEEK